MDSNKIIDEVLCELEKDGHKMTRREAMKLIAMSPLAAGLLSTAATPRKVSRNLKRAKRVLFLPISICRALTGLR
mgnify:CR=1 FL=1